MTTRPMCCVSLRPLCCQVLPPSAEWYTPLPQETLLRALASPAPTQTRSGFVWHTATAPSALVASRSKTGFQVKPLLVVFHSPPDALATYWILGSFSYTATSVM